MKRLYLLLFALVLVVSMISSSIAAYYLVSGAGQEEANGVYVEDGQYDPPKDDDPSDDRGPVTVYRKELDDSPAYYFYLGYRGCPTAAKWVIIKGSSHSVLDNGPGYYDETEGYAYYYRNTNDTLTPPLTNWEPRHDTPAPAPIVTPLYKLTVTTVGWGDVTPDPDDSGFPGFPGYYEAGTPVLLEAAPDTYWSFTSWSGDLGGSTNPQTITMNTDKNVTAIFEGLKDYDVLLSIVGSGTVTLNPSGGTYDANAEVTLTAVADADWAFSEWDGDLSGRANPAVITMNADMNITATFSDDADGDGISNEDEDAGPNGGDANNDGTPDKNQPEIAFTKTYDNQHNVWLEVESPPGATLTGCQTQAPPAGGCGAWVEFPYGFFEFTIEGVDPGGTATVSLHLPAGGVQDTYYKFGPRPGFPDDECYNFMFEPMTQTGAEINGDVITLYFVDGERGDDDLIASGTVQDQGGPGVMFAEETLIGPTGGQGRTTGGGSTSAIGGCFVGTAGGDLGW